MPFNQKKKTKKDKSLLSKYQKSKKRNELAICVTN
jgi:hypothetical protein